MKDSSALVVMDHEEYGLDASTAKKIESVFTPMLEKMTGLEIEFCDVISQEISPETCYNAKALRRKYVKIRTGTAEIHKKAKAHYLAGGRFVDGWKNTQLFASQGKEEALMGIERHYEIIEEERLSGLQSERSDALALLGVDGAMMMLGTMPDDVWGAYHATKKAEREDRLAAEAQAEKDRIASAAKEASRRKLQAEENERLRAETEKQQRKIQAETRKRVKAESELQANRDAELNAKVLAEEERLSKIEADRSKSEAERFMDFRKDLADLADKYSFASVRYCAPHKRAVSRMRGIVEELASVAAVGR